MKTNELMLNTIMNQKEEITALESQVECLTEDVSELEQVVLKFRAERAILTDHYRRAQEMKDKHSQELDILHARIADMAPQKQFRIYGRVDASDVRYSKALTILGIQSANGITSIDVELDA